MPSMAPKLMLTSLGLPGPFDVTGDGVLKLSFPRLHPSNGLWPLRRVLLPLQGWGAQSQRSALPPPVYTPEASSGSLGADSEAP